MKTFIKRVLNKKSKYHYQGIVYLNEIDEPVENEITDRIQWKDKITVEAFSSKEAGKLAFDMFHFKYPELKGKIWLF